MLLKSLLRCSRTRTRRDGKLTRPPREHAPGWVRPTRVRHVPPVFVLLVFIGAAAAPTGCRSLEATQPEERAERPRAEAVPEPHPRRTPVQPEVERRERPERPSESETDRPPAAEKTTVEGQTVPIRVFPAPAGARPGPGEITALGGYALELLDTTAADAGRYAPVDPSVPAEVEHLVREYLEPMIAPGVRLEVTLHGLQRTGSFYGRADILVREAVDLPREYLSETVVRGPTVFSGLSALDAQLASLEAFPREVVLAVTEQVRKELVQRVQLLGLPYHVWTSIPHGDELHRRVESVYRSAGVPRTEADGTKTDGTKTDGTKTDDAEAEQWRFFLPPRDLERYLAGWLHDDGVRVTVIEETRTVIVEVDE